MRRAFELCFILIAFLQVTEGQDPKAQPQPVATVSLFASPPYGQAETGWASLAFTSETSVAVGVCLQAFIGQKCSLALVRWEDGTLQPLAQTLRFDPGVSLHPAIKGQILAVNHLSSAVLYSADLTTSHELPIGNALFSSTGKTVAQWARRGSWKLYRLTDGLEAFREVTGDLRALSEEFVLIQNGNVMRVETLDGKLISSFSVPSEIEGAGLLGNSKLYLDDCKSVRILDFNGKTLLKMHPQKDCGGKDDTRSSADGRRILFDCTNRRVSGLKHWIESARTITTLGMIGPEDFNHEQVRVFDTASGKACFSWQRSFPMTYAQIRSAAISPSGEFVAIVTKEKLSIYRLPMICDGSATFPAGK